MAEEVQVQETQETQVQETESLLALAGEDVTEVQETETVQTDQEPKLFAGKFKTVEELEKGYKNSVAMNARKGDLPPEPTEDNPLGYDIDGALTKAGITPFQVKNDDGTENESVKTFREQTATRLREAKLTGTQLETVAELANQMLAMQRDQMLEAYGAPVDKAGELSKLQEHYGSEWKSKLVAINKWSGVNVPERVRKQLELSADGVLFLDQMRTMQSGNVNPITEPYTNKTFEDIESEIKALMNSEDYNSSNASRQKSAQDKILKLITLQNKKKK